MVAGKVVYEFHVVLICRHADNTWFPAPGFCSRCCSQGCKSLIPIQFRCVALFPALAGTGGNVSRRRQGLLTHSSSKSCKNSYMFRAVRALVMSHGNYIIDARYGAEITMPCGFAVFEQFTVSFGCCGRDMNQANTRY